MDETPEVFRWKAHAMLIRDEGLRLKAYKCTAGCWSIGIGHNLQARNTPALKILYYATVGITRETALALLDEDINTAIADCEAIFGPVFSTWGMYRRLGFINLAFNLGLERLSKFKSTIAHAKAGRWDKVRLHLINSLWYRQVKSRGPRVVALICDERWDYG